MMNQAAKPATMLALLGLCLTGAFAPQLVAGGDSSRPNIVMIISDDHDNEHLGFMGNPVVRTPHIDRLADSGVVFSTCHLTASRCRPSLASLLSGRWPHQNGVYANYHKEKNRGNRDLEGEKMLDPKNSLPNLLAKAGYATYGSGKYWEGDARAMGFTHGLGERRRFGEFARKGQDELFSFIDENAGKKPMFVWWAPLMPHTPHNPPDRFLEMFDRKDIPVPDYITRENRDAFLKKEHLSLAMEAWTDDEIGKLRAKMVASGEDENTLYVFLIDNGWCNGLPAKGSVFEKGVRTPVFFSQPGRIPQGVMRKDLISSLDIYPTILSYAGVEVPESAEGKDLRAAIENGVPVGRDNLFGAIYPTAATHDGRHPERDVYALYVRTEKWKYVYYTRDVQGNVAGKPFKLHHILAEAPLRRRGDENLFNLEEDPYELRDLSGEAGHQKQLRGLKREVFDWWDKSGGKPIPGIELRTADSTATKPANKGSRRQPNILFIAVIRRSVARQHAGNWQSVSMKTGANDMLSLM
jgi:arylsulfatase A-like enzyme